MATTIRDFLLSELKREVDRSRKALEQMPEGKGEWKPHDKSMKFEYLAELVAIIPTWVAMQVTKDELDVAPVDGSNVKRTPKDNARGLSQGPRRSGGRRRSRRSARPPTSTWPRTGS